MKCLFCGCTDECACPEDCYWFVEEVCSTCAPMFCAVLLRELIAKQPSKGKVAERRRNAERLFKLAQKQCLLPTNARIRLILKQMEQEVTT